ncbi:T9SS type A sorting domain-containing protein [Parapedobacter lycopersici]|uniref:T9SS type A sorting domain-containing protein n=1 Tax=Parapedobacter lycopersici TaxID=1864939 RepID=UPI00214D61B3|nr:T9SS type A sorting domain-containing protein [Parapedobacter lycopersici]
MRKFLRDIFVMLMVGAATLIGSVDAALMPAAPTAADSSLMRKGEAPESLRPFQSEDMESRQRSFFGALKGFFPFRMGNASMDDKLLSNVKVFPNPVVDQINLSFRLSKQQAVSIKVMDALGNEVMTLLDQQLDAGNQHHAFETNDKLTNGFYFIRVSAGTETVIKRISVL